MTQQVVSEQGSMNQEAAMMHLTASYRKGMDSVKSEEDWVPADEVERMLGDC